MQSINGILLIGKKCSVCFCTYSFINKTGLKNGGDKKGMKRVFYEVKYAQSEIKQSELSAKILTIPGVQSIMILQPQRISIDVKRLVDVGV